MAEEQRTGIQGELLAQKNRGGIGWTGVITPSDRPQDWYIQSFPTRYVLEEYAREHNLTIAEEQQDDSNSDNRAKRQ